MKWWLLAGCLGLSIVGCSAKVESLPDGGTGGGSGGGVGGGSGGGGGGVGGGGGSDAGALGPSMSEFMGINGLISNPPADNTPDLAAIGNLREYHDWVWNEGNGDSAYPGWPNNQVSFSLWSGFWNFDALYGSMNSKGVFTVPVIQGSTPWLHNPSDPPVNDGGVSTDPASYRAHADFLFQYAARYGQVKVADSLLKLASDQTRDAGEGTLRYLEDYNEQDGWWQKAGGVPIIAADEYAAMASADYDGDQGRLGPTYGVKSADPSMKLVMGGLAGGGPLFPSWVDSITAYLDGIRTWSASHRGGNFPADVVNAHYYSFGPGNGAPALSPEADQVEAKMISLRQYRDANLPGKELWISEFGYDVDPASALHAPAIGSSSAQVTQAQWILRTYLALLSGGVDRAFMYILDDTCTGSCPTQFSTSGLITQAGAKKPAFYVLAAFRSRLLDYRYAGKVQSGDANVRILSFKEPSSGKGALVLWAPTSNGTTVSGYSLDVTGATSAKAVRLTGVNASGDETALTLASGHVAVDVDETPVIVLTQ